jgi:hypothetical protein
MGAATRGDGSGVLIPSRPPTAAAWRAVVGADERRVRGGRQRGEGQVRWAGPRGPVPGRSCPFFFFFFYFFYFFCSVKCVATSGLLQKV